MSVPFPNTHLRVPRGFGTILEGLTREILRDQPEDIPKYAAEYFDVLLRKREESGVGLAEWVAGLEDKVYDCQASKPAGAIQEKEPEVTPSKDTSYESQTEDESSHSVDVSNLSIAQADNSKETDSTENKEEEEHDNTEKIISTEEELCVEPSVHIVPAEDKHSDELSGPEEKDAQKMTTFEEDDRNEEKDKISLLEQSELDPSDLLAVREISTTDICAQELAEDEVGVKSEAGIVEQEAEDEDRSEVENQVVAGPYSGLADVNVCAAELEETGRAIDGDTAEGDTHFVEEDESSRSKPERGVEQSLSESKTPEGNQDGAEDQAEITKEGGGDGGDSSGEKHESLAGIEGGLDSNATAKEESLVEISFEDVPEARQTKEEGEKPPQEEASAEVLDTTLSEIQQEEECEVTAAETDQNKADIQSDGEPEIVGAENELNSQEQELQRQHEASDITEEEGKVAKDPNLSESDGDEEGGGGKNIILPLELTPEAVKENLEDETEPRGEDNELISEGEIQQNNEETSNDPEVEDDEEAIPVEDKGDTETQGNSSIAEKSDNRGEEDQSLEEIQSNISTPALQAESKSLQLLSEEGQRAFMEQQEGTAAEKEVTLKEETLPNEELIDEGKIDSCAPEKSDATCEEGGISSSNSVEEVTDEHREEERPPGSEKDTAEPEVNGINKEECSRPQEEEDIMDIPLDDPEANRAAAKIQAGFRGHMTRKKMKPEDKTEREEVSSTGDVLNGSQGDTETGGSGAVERDDTSVPEQ